MGLERVIMLMEQLGVEIPNENQVKVFIASAGENANKKAFEICYKLRLNGIGAETDHMERGFKSQFKYADKINAEYVIAIGDNELESGTVNVKKMSDGSTESVEIDKITAYFM